MQKQPSCIKRVWPSKSLGEKTCEIKRGGYEMAVMMLMVMKFCSHPFYTVWLFLHGSLIPSGSVDTEIIALGPGPTLV